jgi:hypothetical protein
LVRLAGIEPTTPWFVAKYSIQLSYSRSGKTKVYHRNQLPLRGAQVIAAMENNLRSSLGK